MAKRSPYSAVPEHIALIGGDGHQRMDVVEGAAFGQLACQRRSGPGEGDLVPADVGQLQACARQRADLAGDQAEALGSALLAGALEGELHPQTDPQHRGSGGDALAQELAEPEPREVRHRPREGPDAGQDEPRGGRQAIGVELTSTRAPTCSRAFSTERRLPMP